MRAWTVDDVMTTAVVSVDGSASYRNLVDLLVEHHVSAVPVIDAWQRVVGVVSEADLLRRIEFAGDGEPRLFESRHRRGERAKARSRTAADLMSAPAVVVPVGTSIAAAAREMDRARVKRLPVVDDRGRLVGVVSRGDLLKVHLRSDEEILAEVTGVVRRFLIEDAASVTVAVVDGVVVLSGRVGRWSAADIAVRLAGQVPGVVEVTSTLEFAFDDRKLLTSGMFFGVA